jgi:hypothetical protein
MKHLFAKIALGGWLLLGSAGIAAAGSKSMVYLHNFTPAETQQVLAGGANPYDLHTEKLPSGRVILKANAETRFEAELQGTLKDADHHSQTVAKLDALANDPAMAQKMFGKGYTIVKLNKPPRNVWDFYVDSKDGLLAGSNASLRVRTEGGFSALNYKPGSRVDYENGMTHRIEGGINIKPLVNGKPSAGQLKLFSDPSLAYNPMREFGKQYPGRNVADVFDPSVDIKQLRTMYEIQLNGTKHGEISVDIVNFRDPLDHTKAGQFFRIEMEGDHLNANPTASQIANSANAPHDATDTLDPDNDKNPDIIELHRLNDVLVAHVGSKPAGMAKVTEARQLLGKPIAKVASAAGTLRASLAKGQKLNIQQQSGKKPEKAVKLVSSRPVPAKGSKGRVGR